MQDNYYNNS